MWLFIILNIVWKRRQQGWPRFSPVMSCIHDMCFSQLNQNFTDWEQHLLPSLCHQVSRWEVILQTTLLLSQITFFVPPCDKSHRCLKIPQCKLIVVWLEEQLICQNNLPLHISIYVHPAAIIRHNWWSVAGGRKRIEELIKTFRLIHWHKIKGKKCEGGILLEAQ